MFHLRYAEMKYGPTKHQSCVEFWRPTNKFPQGINIIVKNINNYWKQDSVWWDRCCKEDMQMCSGNPKEEQLDLVLKESEAEKCKNTAFFEKCKKKNAWGETNEFGRQAREEMYKETGYQRKELWWFILVVMRNHWKSVSKGLAWSDFYFRKITLRMKIRSGKSERGD